MKAEMNCLVEAGQKSKVKNNYLVVAMEEKDAFQLQQTMEIID